MTAVDLGIAGLGPGTAIGMLLFFMVFALLLVFFATTGMGQPGDGEAS